MSDSLNWRIEEACFNAWPALRQVILNGWLLRFSQGLTRRANSANPLSPATTRDFGSIRTSVEALYGEQNLPAIFRLPGIADASFEKTLTQAGYKSEGRSLVLHAPIENILTKEGGKDIEITSTPSWDWLAGMSVYKKFNDRQTQTYKNMLNGIIVPAAFLALRHEGAIVSVAYGALSNGLLCVESVFTDTNFRGRFFAKRVLAAMAEWARQKGTQGVCLQVEAGNQPANTLYKSLGLRELYRYHYMHKQL